MQGAKGTSASAESLHFCDQSLQLAWAALFLNRCGEKGLRAMVQQEGSAPESLFLYWLSFSAT